MTTPPPGVDVKPMWRGKDFLRWGVVGAAAGAAFGLLFGALLSALLGESGPPSLVTLMNWAGVILLGVAIAWMPGSARAGNRGRSALYGTDDEVARLKYRVLRGRELQLTEEETARGRYLARVMYFSALAEVASSAALLTGLAVMRVPDLFDAERRLLAGAIVGFALVAVVTFLIFASRKRANARRFLDETAHLEGTSVVD